MYAPYAFTTHSTETSFAFISEGPRGRLPKLVTFEPTDVESVFTVGLFTGTAVERDPERHQRDRTDNGDARRVVDTVIAAIDRFLDRFPDRWVTYDGYFGGRFDPVRMRLYRMAITANLAYLQTRVTMYGILPDEVSHELYDPTHDYVTMLFRSRQAPA